MSPSSGKGGVWRWHERCTTSAGSANQKKCMRKVLIVGGDADFNLGDTAILVSLVRCITRHSPDTTVTILSSRSDFHRLLPRNARILKRSWASGAQLLQAAWRQDLIIVGGGGLFQDDDSRIKMPYWAARIAALRTLNANIVGHALGAGPLVHPESQGMARAACDMLKAVTVRDPFAQKWLTHCTGQTPDVIPDPAFMLPPAPAELARAYLRGLGLEPGRPLIAVALRRWFHSLGGFVPHRLRARAGLGGAQGAAEMNELLGGVAQAVSRLAKRMDASVLLMPTYTVDHEADHRPCAGLVARLPGVRTAIARIADPSLYKAVVGQAQLLVSARMHPLILAAGMGVPLVGLAYNGKFAGLFDLLSLPEPLWLEDFRRAAQADTLEKAATAALANSDHVRSRASELATRVERSTRELIREPLAA